MWVLRLRVIFSTFAQATTVLALKQVPNFPEAQTKEMNHSKQLHIGAALCQSLPSYPPKPPQPCSPKLDENG